MKKGCNFFIKYGAMIQLVLVLFLLLMYVEMYVDRRVSL